ncbi:AAA family ATPase [Streptococcus sobrinus]|uniref:Protein CR006 P-loop domain-containing protein n=1 Tax=Streptococcus sobrinus W1703 TaxID=1227275 RepID=U2K934_9STRE|nr:AAA family ATPase [Streptococcus sobrinus]ERJ73669.1 hypothetical protein HMPREF1557_02241 [Streptococcus sobrinus W1703]
MVETKINLSIIQFADTSEPLFTGKELILSSKNFIFAKNGSGKSTLSDAIVNQKSSDFDVQVFKGFEQLIGENENLDAFSLAVDAGEKEEEIRKLNKKLEEKRSNYTQSNQKITKPENGEENLFSKLEASKNAHEEQEHKLDKFYIGSARNIKTSNPQLVTSSLNYNKNHFKDEINQASLLQDVEINQLKQVLKSESKNISTINFEVIDFNKYLSAVNNIISSKVEERVKIKRLDNQEKINFAKTGLHIHEKGQVCAFCGNEITDNTFNELESYFSADEVKALQNRIKKGKEQIKNVQDKLDDLELTAEGFYPNLIGNATDEIEKIKIAKGGQ